MKLKKFQKLCDETAYTSHIIYYQSSVKKWKLVFVGAPTGIELKAITLDILINSAIKLIEQYRFAFDYKYNYNFDIDSNSGFFDRKLCLQNRKGGNKK